MHSQSTLNTFSGNNNHLNPPNPTISSLNPTQGGISSSTPLLNNSLGGLIGSTPSNLLFNSQTGGQSTGPANGTSNSWSLASNPGTVDYIGRNKIRYAVHREWGIPCISAVIRTYNLEELRMADYFHLKNDTFPADKKHLVLNVIHENIRKRDAAQNLAQSSAILSNNSIQSLPSGNSLLGSAAPLTSGNLFVNSRPFVGSQGVTGNLNENAQKTSQINPPAVLNELSASQDSFIVDQQMSPNQKPPFPKNSLQPQKTEKQTAETNFSSEMNKMLFFSGLVQLMEKHNFSVPENLLDNASFVPRLLEFLEKENISLPTENIPRFQIDTITPLLSQLDIKEGESSAEEYSEE